MYTFKYPTTVNIIKYDDMLFFTFEGYMLAGYKLEGYTL